MRDLRSASRMKDLEQGIVNKHLAQADLENEKSRQEMTSMKEAGGVCLILDRCRLYVEKT